jgi:hypothetical protein
MTALTTTTPPIVTPLVLLQQAIDKGIEPDQLATLMDLQERFERNRAAEAYAAAITQFQSRCPQIKKERKPTSGPTYTYASYDDVMLVAGPLLAECGISVSFSTKTIDKALEATCKLRVGTHTEEHSFTVPVPEMRVNDTQRFGAALRYAQRYALCGALNIVVTDEDVDAGNLTVNTITEEQVIQIEDWILSTDSDRAKFLKAFSIEKLSDLPAAKFQNAIDAFKKKQAGK